MRTATLLLGALLLSLIFLLYDATQMSSTEKMDNGADAAVQKGNKTCYIWRSEYGGATLAKKYCVEDK